MFLILVNSGSAFCCTSDVLLLVQKAKSNFQKTFFHFCYVFFLYTIYIGNDFKLKEGRFRSNVRKKIFYHEGGETHVAQGICGCPIPESVQGQGFEQPELVKDAPALVRRSGLNEL